PFGLLVGAWRIDAAGQSKESAAKVNIAGCFRSNQHGRCGRISWHGRRTSSGHGTMVAWQESFTPKEADLAMHRLRDRSAGTLRRHREPQKAHHAADCGKSGAERQRRGR